MKKLDDGQIEILKSKAAEHGFIRTEESLEYLLEVITAIRKHRDQKGDDRCWQDDAELYQILPEGHTPPAVDEPVMLENCKRYIERRQCPLTKYVPNLVEQAVHDLIARKAVHAKKGTVMGQEKWANVFNHLKEEIGEFDTATTMLVLAMGGLHTPFTAENLAHQQNHIQAARNAQLEELGDIYGLVVHAIVKAGFTVRQVEERELEKLKERFPTD